MGDLTDNERSVEELVEFMIIELTPSKLIDIWTWVYCVDFYN